jgi:uncharacterized protein (DUF305 family)
MSASQARRIIAVVASVSLAACRTAPREAPSAGPTPPASASRSDSAAIAKAQADSARHPYTVADVDFMAHMIAHHAQAIEMSRLAPTNGASPSIRTLAERIINAQQDEIALMQQWLHDRRQAVPEAHSTAMPMEHAGHEMMMMMPGMLTPAQMKQLEEARGAEFDRLFLTFMIQHHRGAIEMVKQLFATPGAAQDPSVFKLASDVSVDQSTEVARMTQMLAALISK